MQLYSKPASRKPPTLCRLACLLLLFIALPAQSHASGFEVLMAQTRLQENVYLLDSRVKLRFSDEAQKALQSGIPLIILLDIEVEKERWWWNKNIATLQQGYLLLYHALTEKYIVNHLNSGAQHDYTSLGATLSALERIRDLPLIDSSLLIKGDEYQARLRVRLDIESLPAPMRPLAYISSDWQLASDWYTWPLKH